jgi:gluconokinase
MRILALDLGTSSVRGLVLDAAARPVPGALARRQADVRLGDEGEATLDAAAYLGALVECLDELAGNDHLDDVELVVASAQWHSVVPLDAGGAPLGPVLTWLDTRPRAAGGAGGPRDADGPGRAPGPAGRGRLPPTYRGLVAPLLLVGPAALAAPAVR